MRYSTNPAVWALLALFTLISLAATASESPDSPGSLSTLTLQQAISRALATHPGIEAARIEVDVAQARRDAGALPTPFTMGAELENFAGTGSVSGLDAIETTLSVSRVLELGDKREYRTALGDATVDLSRIDVKISELDLVGEVTRRYADLLRRQEQIALADESVALNNRTLEIVERRVAAGRASEAERSSAAVALLRSELFVRQLQIRLEGSRAGLAVLWGSRTPDFGAVAGNILDLPALPTRAALEARVSENPQMRRIATAERALEAQKRLTISKRRPDIEFSAGVRHLADANDMAMVFSFSMPFGSRDRATPLIREADLAIARSSVVRNDQLVDLRSALTEFAQRVAASRIEFETLRDRIIPEAENSVRFYERGFEFGSHSLLELTAAQQQLLSLRSEALEAAVTCQLTLIEIESLLGNANPGGGLL